MRKETACNAKELWGGRSRECKEGNYLPDETLLLLTSSLMEAPMRRGKRK